MNEWDQSLIQGLHPMKLDDKLPNVLSISKSIICNFGVFCVLLTFDWISAAICVVEAVIMWLEETVFVAAAIAEVVVELEVVLEVVAVRTAVFCDDSFNFIFSILSGIWFRFEICWVIGDNEELGLFSPKFLAFSFDKVASEFSFLSKDI